jgi:Na+-transporting methylmalonyl-CoA/oxaloacetate decarboxylase gamma subunit
MNQGLTGHVPVLSILLIVHGVLMSLLGLMILALGVITVVEGLSNGDDLVPVITPAGCYLLMCLCGLVGGSLQIFGGISAYQWKRYKLFKAAVVSTVLGLGTCYCILTSLAIFVWGLVVVNDISVQERFASPELPDYPPSAPENSGYYS